MDIRNIAGNIIRLPERFYARKNVSMYSLLRESGYVEARDQISKDKIYDELMNHPKYVTTWLIWSENKRTSSGWYFKQSETGRYIVGYFSSSGENERNEYPNIVEACAAFIKQEIEDIFNS